MSIVFRKIVTFVVKTSTFLTSTFLKIGNFKNFVTFAIPEFKQTSEKLRKLVRFSIINQPYVA